MAVEWGPFPRGLSVHKSIGLSRCELTILIVLAQHANFRDGVAYPSIQTLGDETGYSRRHVQQSIERLVEKGLLDVVPGGGRHRSNQYRFIVDGVVIDGFGRRETAQSRERCFDAEESQKQRSNGRSGEDGTVKHLAHSGTRNGAPQAAHQQEEQQKQEERHQHPAATPPASAGRPASPAGGHGTGALEEQRTHDWAVRVQIAKAYEAALMSLTEAERQILKDHHGKMAGLLYACPAPGSVMRDAFEGDVTALAEVLKRHVEEIGSSQGGVPCG